MKNYRFGMDRLAVVASSDVCHCFSYGAGEGREMSGVGGESIQYSYPDPVGIELFVFELKIL
jgi:hypothetical protein